MRADQPTHVLVVHPLADALVRYSIECPGVTDHCRMWEEADCPQSKANDEWGGDTWFDWTGEDTAHGVKHAHIDDIGWTHPTERCWLREYPDLRDAADPLGLPPGRYRVTHTYVCSGEGEFELDLVGADDAR